MPQLLKKVLEFFKNYFLSQFMSFTRKSVLLLYNYTFFFFLKLYYPAWSPTWFTTLGSKLTWLFPKLKFTLKDEDLPLLKMCLRLWRQFPKRSPKMCMASYPLPASKLKSSSFSKTSSGPCFCQAPSHCLGHSKAPWKGCLYWASPFYFSPPSHSSTDYNLLWLPEPLKQLMK